MTDQPSSRPPSAPSDASSVNFVMAVDAAFPIKLGVDLHLATGRSPREIAACADCGRAMWMHGTRHDTCVTFSWVTKHTITESQIRTLMGIARRREPTVADCEEALGKRGEGPAWVAKGVCAAIINTAKNRALRLTPEPVATRSTIGAGPYVVLREPLKDGTFQIQLDPDNPPMIGHGNTRREAAKHLAEQLREQARLIMKIEGDIKLQGET